MKITRIIVILLLLMLPIVIYVTNIDKKIYYLALGDSLAIGQNPYGKIGYGYSDYVGDYLKNKKVLEFYTKKYAVSGYRTTDLIRDINDNKKIIVDNQEITIKNALTNADIVTLSIGANDLFYKLGLTNANVFLENPEQVKPYIDEVLIDIEKLIILIKLYCKEDIIMVGYYNPLWQMNISHAEKTESLFLYANNKMKLLADKYNVYYVDIYELFKENNDFLPNPLDIHPSNSGYKAISDQIITIIEENILNWLVK